MAEFKMYRVSRDGEMAIISRMAYEKIHNKRDKISLQECLDLILKDEFKRLSKHINFDKAKKLK